MPVFEFYCGQCKALQRADVAGGAFRISCDRCGADIRGGLFPAVLRGSPVGSAAKDLVDGGEAGCFYHPTKKAAESCGSCGRFICDMCHIPMAGNAICPVCLERETRDNKNPRFKFKYIRYDNIALLLALVSLVLWPLSFVTGSIAIFLSVKYFNKEQSPFAKGGRPKFVMSIALSAIMILLTGYIIVMSVIA